MNIRMDDAEKLSLEGIGRFVTASEEIQFAAENREQLYGWLWCKYVRGGATRPVEE